MKMSKLCKALKSFAEWFSTSGGAAAFAFGVVGTLVSIPAMITLPVACGVGLLFGLYGAYSKWKELVEKEKKSFRKNKQRDQAVSEVHEIKKELDELKDVISSKRDSTPEIIAEVGPDGEIKFSPSISIRRIPVRKPLFRDKALQTSPKNPENEVVENKLPEVEVATATPEIESEPPKLAPQ